MRYTHSHIKLGQSQTWYRNDWIIYRKYKGKWHWDIEKKRKHTRCFWTKKEQRHTKLLVWERKSRKKQRKVDKKKKNNKDETRKMRNETQFRISHVLFTCAWFAVRSVYLRCSITSVFHLIYCHIKYVFECSTY